MTALLIAWCTGHAPVQVDYLCTSALWAVFWFALGWLTCHFTAKHLGGHK